MELWLEGETSVAQEHELTNLACELWRDPSAALSDSDRRDINMLVGLAAVDTSEIPTANTVTHKRRTLWTIISAAAVLALLLCAGIWMFHPEDKSSAPQLAKAEQADVPHKDAIAQADMPAEHPSAPGEEEAVSASEPVETTAESHVVATTRMVKAETSCPADTISVREVTDPDEALALMNESCTLLAESFRIAEQNSTQAAQTIADKISKLTDII